MLPALTSLMGGGGISAGGGGPSTASTGDASSGLTNSFQYNAGFTVGGSGQTSAKQESAQSQSMPGNNVLLYAALGLAGFAILMMTLKK
jgi:hypothetical protein